jgi:hypothetical protein
MKCPDGKPCGCEVPIRIHVPFMCGGKPGEMMTVPPVLPGYCERRGRCLDQEFEIIFGGWKEKPPATGSAK